MDSMRDYNVLVTFHQNEKAKAEEEVADRLRDAGLILEDLMESRSQGVVLVRVTGSGKEAINKLRIFALRFPELFRHTHHWTPIEEWVSSTPDSLVSAARVFGSRIREGDRWKMVVEKRNYQGGSTSDLIRMLTEPIEHGEVDLEEPDLILMVVIDGEFAGFSLLSEDEYLDINKVRTIMGLARIS
jgi:hypothetical protein